MKIEVNVDQRKEILYTIDDLKNSAPEGLYEIIYQRNKRDSGKVLVISSGYYRSLLYISSINIEKFDELAWGDHHFNFISQVKIKLENDTEK